MITLYSARVSDNLLAESYLEGLQKRVEIYEDDLGDLVLSRVDEEQHVGDPQEREKNQRGLHGFPAKR